MSCYFGMAGLKLGWMGKNGGAKLKSHRHFRAKLKQVLWLEDFGPVHLVRILEFFLYSTPEKNLMWSIQNKTPNDINKFTYVIRSFILNTPHKIFFGVWYSKTPDQVNGALKASLSNSSEKLIYNKVLCSNMVFKKWNRFTVQYSFHKFEASLSNFHLLRAWKRIFQVL